MVGVASVGEFVSPSGPEQAPVECELCLSCSSVRSRRRAKPKRATGGNVSQCGLTEQRAEGFWKNVRNKAVTGALSQCELTKQNDPRLGGWRLDETTKLRYSRLTGCLCWGSSVTTRCASQRGIEVTRNLAQGTPRAF